VLAAYEVGFRYIEYCITAPLLFLAVMSLLVVDAPTWLFLMGYWLIQACNAFGLAFHATLCSDLYRDTQETAGGREAFHPQNASVIEWIRALTANGSW
jgi:hypothetical protein